MMRWPDGKGGRRSVWAQKSNPLFDNVVRGFRPIRLSSRRSVPLKRSPDDNHALIVGGHILDGDGAYYAIGHRLLRRQKTGLLARLGTRRALAATKTWSRRAYSSA